MLATSLPALLARPNILQYYQYADQRARSMAPRVARSAPVARSSASTAARARRISWPTSREHALAFTRSAVADLDSTLKHYHRLRDCQREAGGRSLD